MWVIGKSYPACKLQNHPEMKHCRKERHLQNYQVSADLSLIAWNDSSWQHKANLTSLEKSFKGRRCFLAPGKGWAGNSGYKAQNRVGAILRSSVTYYNTQLYLVQPLLYKTRKNSNWWDMKIRDSEFVPQTFKGNDDLLLQPQAVI